MPPTIEELEAKIARLDQEKESLVAELLQNYEELNLVYETAELFSNVFRLNHIADMLLDKATEIAHAQLCWMVVQPIQPQDGIRVMATRPEHQKTSPLIPWINTHIVNPVLKSGRKQIINNISEHFDTIPAEFTAEQASVAVMAIPLSVAGNVHGVACLCRTGADQIFTARESKMVSVLCSQAAPTFKNAAFLNQIKRRLSSDDIPTY
ncbi:MAG: GAF domain-containing protein [Gemmatimonadetes bacterium]|nr:MAG: GAF domain-containing protein [Gemmatimonadota bacterium]